MIHTQRFETAGLSNDGFSSLGEFLLTVRQEQVYGARDARLKVAPVTRQGLNENDPTAGGFAVPELFSSKIIVSIYEAAVLAPLCDVTELTGPPASYSEPSFDETSRQDGSRWGGTLAYWLAESASVPASRPRFRKNEYTGHKLILLSYVTGELFSDAAMLEEHFERAMSAEGSFKLDLGILAGTGAGQPMGILTAPATITVSKQSGQAAKTIVAENIDAMWKRLPAPCRRRAVWIVNEDVEEQLASLGPTASAPTYLPMGSAAGNPWPLLKGRPVLTIEQAPVLGTPGDIVLADLGYYRVVQGAPRFAMSADVAFLTDENAFRLTLRVDGKPSWTTPITPFNGSAITRSPFVALAAR